MGVAAYAETRAIAGSHATTLGITASRYARPLGRIGQVQMSIRQGKDPHRTLSRWRIASLSVGLALLGGAALVIIPAASPGAGAATADFLRSAVGPEPVARLESISFWMQDQFYLLLPASPGAGPSVTWLSSQEPEALTPSPIVTGTAGSPLLELLPPTPLPVAEATPEPAFDVVTAPPAIGWQPYGPLAGNPLLARSILMVDPQRSYAGVALVRIDLSQLQLHIMAGFIEPAHPSGIEKQIPELGTISPLDEGQLVAAFNGGFKAVHGHYGMMVDGVTLLGPVDGMATLAVYQDGSVRLGAWGRGVVESPDMIAFRQNCLPLLEDGELNPALTTNARKAWGMTNNTDVTWRTAVGLAENRRYLIYAVGNGTTLEFLAKALQEAGAYNAMQLDINQYYAHFVTYSAVDNASGDGGTHLEAQRLLEQMIDIRKLYLAPHPRDFFYLTLRE